MVHTVYICCFFRFDASLKKLFISSNYHVLFAWLAPMVFKVNTANIQYFWIFLDIQIMQDPLCTAILTIIFFHDYSNGKYDLCFSFVGLILWLKVYVAFNDLHILKIMLCECKMSPKVEQNRKPKVFEIYWEKINLVFPPPFLGGQH